MDSFRTSIDRYIEAEEPLFEECYDCGEPISVGQEVCVSCKNKKKRFKN